jgi:hypothetical protein
LLELAVEGAQVKEALEGILCIPPPHHSSHNPKPLLPDTTVVPGNAIKEAVLWQSQHTKGSSGGMLEHFWGEPEGVGQTQSNRRKTQGETGGLGDAGEGWLRGGELLLSVGAVRPPWDSGAVEWSQLGQRGPWVPLDEMDKALG